jgi:ribosomal protein S18 acetylase RimI-like enzyme
MGFTHSATESRCARNFAGRGYGRAIAAAAETKCREMRVVSIGLTVFGPNNAAQSLYQHLGFEVTVLQMREHLSTRQQGVTSANR